MPLTDEEKDVYDSACEDCAKACVGMQGVTFSDLSGTYETVFAKDICRGLKHSASKDDT